MKRQVFKNHVQNIFGDLYWPTQCHCPKCNDNNPNLILDTIKKGKEDMEVEEIMKSDADYHELKKRFQTIECENIVLKNIREEKDRVLKWWRDEEDKLRKANERIDMLEKILVIIMKDKK
jgi:hypothetical protein